MLSNDKMAGKLTSIFATTVAPDKADKKQEQQKECNDTQKYDEPAGTCNTLLHGFCSTTETSSHLMPICK